MDGILIDGRTYHVRVVYNSLEESFTILNGPAAGTAINEQDILDIRGTKYSYTLAVEPDPSYLLDYDALWNVFSAPVETHTVTLPDSQSVMSFTARVTGGRRIYNGKNANVERWNGLSISFIPTYPQRLPEVSV